MSLELYAFLEEVPDRQTWQAAIDESGIDLQLDPDLDVFRDEGFSPCQLNGKPSGFEILLTDTPTVLDEIGSAAAAVAAAVGSRSNVVCFRWGSDLAELACVLAATLALVRKFEGVIYDPGDDVLFDEGSLEKDLKECMART